MKIRESNIDGKVKFFIKDSYTSYEGFGDLIRKIKNNELAEIKTVSNGTWSRHVNIEYKESQIQIKYDNEAKTHAILLSDNNDKNINNAREILSRILN